MAVSGNGARSIPDPVYSAAVVDRVGRNLRADVVPLLERIARPRLRVDERGDLLRFLVGQAARIQIRHRVADDAGQRVDARRAGAVVPRSGAPQRTGLLVADLHALTVGAVAGRAPLGVDRFAFRRVELGDRDQLVGGDRVLVRATPGWRRPRSRVPAT